MRKVCVDADVLVYHASFACQKHRYVYDGMNFDDFAKLRDYLKTQELKPNEVEYEKILDVLDEDKVDIIAQKFIDMIEEECQSYDLEFYLSGPTNFRNDVATIQPYKGNRQSEKPVHFEYAKYWFNRIATAVSDNEEADDLLAQRQRDLGYEAIIATIDKDLMQIPGRHFNWNKRLKFKVSPEDGDRWFWLQMLQGDKADNIPGIPRVGEKTALKLLDGLDHTGRRQVVEGKYQKTYGAEWEAAYLEVGRLLWMRRQPGELWTPELSERYLINDK